MTILAQHKALSVLVIPKFINTFFFLFVGLSIPPEIKVYEAVPTTNKESIGKGKPRKPLGLPINIFLFTKVVHNFYLSNLSAIIVPVVN